MSSEKASDDWTHTDDQKVARDNLMGLMDKVEETKAQMAANVEMALERGDKLKELEEHSDKISNDAAKLAQRMDQLADAAEDEK